MLRVAFVNMGVMGKTIRKFFEPSHLLGMHAVCEMSGHKSTIIQYGLPNPAASIGKIKRFQPDVLGLSFIAYNEEEVRAAQDILRAFPGKRPRLILGGTGVSYYTRHLIEQFFPYYEKDASVPPFFIVQGAGEVAVRALAQFNFNPLGLDRSTMDVYGIQSRIIQGTPVIWSRYTLSLDGRSFKRPYKLSLFGGEANVQWEDGCKSACSFCGNNDRDISYRKPTLVLEELAYLRRLGVTRTDILTANFTAIPRKASAIMAALPRENALYVLMNSRVDTLFFSITRHPEAWKGFMGEIALGVESFDPDRLGPKRLRKYPSLTGAKLQEERLRYICDFFKAEDVWLPFYLIPFDWEMDLVEVKLEINRTLDYYRKYPKVTVPLWCVGNILGFEPGSPLSFEKAGIDFYNCRRDPRVLLLAAVMSIKADELYDRATNELPVHRELSLVAFQYMLRCLRRLKKISPDQIDLEPILKKIHAGGLGRGIPEEFYLQLGKEGIELEKYFKREGLRVEALIRSL